VGEYPPPHFEEDEYDTDPDKVGEQIYGVVGPDGRRHWFFKKEGDAAAAYQWPLSRLHST